jgi:hypothetical protein
MPHPGGRTFGFRGPGRHSAVAYLSDHCPTQPGSGPDGVGEYHGFALGGLTASTGSCTTPQHTAAESMDLP